MKMEKTKKELIVELGQRLDEVKNRDELKKPIARILDIVKPKQEERKIEKNAV